MKKRFSLFVMVLVCLALVAGTVLACTDDETTPETPVSDSSAYAGRYYAYVDSTNLSADRYIDLDTAWGWSDSDGATGTFTVSDGEIKFYLSGTQDEVYSGGISGDTMNLVGEDGNIHVYRKGVPSAPEDTGDNGSGGDEPAPVVKYTVRFDSLGGSAVASVEANAGSTIAAPANPTRENYNFTGWYKNAACTEIWDFSTDKVNADTTLYAGWTGEDGKILAVENATIEDTDIFMPVRHTVEYVSLANSVTIGGRGTWKLYKDILGTQEIPTKIAAGDNGVLLNGDNTFYIVATSSDGQQVRTYTMTIHRSYSVPLHIKDPYGDVCATSSAYTYYDEITPNRSFTGYTVNAWTCSDPNWSANGTVTGSATFTPVCRANSYTVTLNANGGTLSGNNTKSVTYDSSYSLGVPSRTGYTFTGWTLSGDPVTNAYGTSLSVWKRASDTTLYAGWQINSYSVNLSVSDSDAGKVSGAGTYEYTARVTITASVNNGYSFNGWYEGDTLISDDSTYTFSVPAKNVSYTAKFEIATYSIEYVDTYGAEHSNPTRYTMFDEDITLASLDIDHREHYEFAGWYIGDEPVTVIEQGTYGDLTIIAKWTPIVYGTITYELNGGINAAGNPSEYTILTLGSDGAITLSSPTKTGDLSYTSNSDGTFDVTRGVYTFEGWYSNPEFTGNAVTEITIDTGNVTLYAKWSESATTTNTTEQLYTRSGSTIYFGEYPQTEVTDSAITTALNGMRGTLPTSSNSYDWTSYGYYISGDVTNFMWYIDLEYSGEKYRGVYFTSYRPNRTTNSSSTSNSYQDDNGYSTGTVYWFKYEPIKWRILTESDGKAMILSELMLDSQQYDYDGSYSNNYANSTIRAWLNDTFYNTAFGAMQQAIIETTEVDNSVYSTGYSSNPYACENTFDKVFLLSYREVVNSSYGFSTSTSNSTTRQKQGSDYCKVQGSWISNGFAYDGNGFWWLRSPYYTSYSIYAWYVTSDGGLGYSIHVHNTTCGVVPALVISL